MVAEPRITTTLRYLPADGTEVTYGTHGVASALVIGSLAASILMPLAILWPVVSLADFLVVETLVRIFNAILVFAFLSYFTRDTVWTFPRCETIIASPTTLTISRRLCGVRTTRRFKLRPGALGVQFETSWSSAQKPRYRLHYESGRRKCDFARGLSEQTARELLMRLSPA
ncbi:MAG: hypothetical protein K2Y37_13440 [Pirellulales bacterium]|nr:hypothetical protein [Pirellulales bacterium]